MGLGIFIGLLARDREEDLERYEERKAELAIINEQLAAHGLPAHHEPETCVYWDSELYGYSGLHYLRRIAAHLDLRGTLPPPGTDDAADDPVLAEYYAQATAGGVRGLLGKLMSRKRRGFDHLILHSDAQGYYVPIDFADVISSEDLPGEMVGSSQRLLQECVRLREVLGVPPDLDPESEVFWDAIEQHGVGTGWQRYAIEAFACARLLHGATLSVERGAVLVFS